MNVLILGGITEARQIAQQIHQLGHQVIVSVAGLTTSKKQTADYEIRRGGFGGVEKLANYLLKQSIDLLIDATHPYAASISANASKACQQHQTPIWAYRRPAWQASQKDQWLELADWESVIEKLTTFKRPLFTIGLTPLSHPDDCLPNQQWFVRVLPAAEPLPKKAQKIQILLEKGPFTLEQEHQLFDRIKPDILISKNSGGTFVQAKLQLASERGIPVIMLKRPSLPTLNNEFDSVAKLLEAFELTVTSL